MSKGIFFEASKKYFAMGINVIPVEGKAPKLNGWQKYCEDKMPETLQAQVSNSFAVYNIGLPCGSYNGVDCFDLDIDCDSELGKKILAALPETQIKKIGKKGITLFYKHNRSNPVKSVSYRKVFDFLSTGRHTVLPPSIHPDTGAPYRWEGASPTPELLDSLPYLTIEHIKAVTELANAVYGNIKEVTPGRNDKLKDMASAAHFKNKSLDTIVDELLKYDSSNHKPPLFSDSTEPGMSSTEPRVNALHFVERIIFSTSQRNVSSERLPALKTQSFGDFKKKEIPPIEWIVDEFLARGTTAIFGGDPKVGKSTMARQIAVSILAEKCFLGRATKHTGKILVTAMEEHESELRKNLFILANGLNVSLDENLIVVTDNSGPVKIEDINDTILRENITFAILDPMTFFTSEMRDNDDYKGTYDFYTKLNAVAKTTNCHILIISHLKKAGRENGDDFGRIVGSVAHSAATFTNVTLRKDSAGNRVLETRQKAGKSFDSIKLDFSFENQLFSQSKDDIRQSPLEEKRAQLLKVLFHNPQGLTEAELAQQVKSKGSVRLEALNSLLSENRVYRKGNGKKNDPFIYFVTALIPGGVT